MKPETTDSSNGAPQKSERRGRGGRRALGTSGEIEVRRLKTAPGWLVSRLRAQAAEALERHISQRSVGIDTATYRTGRATGSSSRSSPQTTIPSCI